MKYLKGKLKYVTLPDVRRMSARLHPSRQFLDPQLLQRELESPSVVFEQWQNDIYDVVVRRHYDEPVPVNTTEWEAMVPRMIQIGLGALDGSARHDWREFQRMKNFLAGPEWEGVELYPAESRLVDPSNYFYVWCFPKKFMFGFNERRVVTPANCVAPQRGWHKDDEPKDASDATKLKEIKEWLFGPSKNPPEPSADQS